MPNATSQHFPQDLVSKTEYAKLSSSPDFTSVFWIEHGSICNI